MRNPTFVLALGAMIVAVAILAVSGQNTTSIRQQMPAHIRNAPERVVAAYEYAATHGEELANHPCYCGCVYLDHTSNLSCYVQSVNPDGTIVWDNHALGCGNCVDIALDVQRLKTTGWSSPDIRDYIDQTYGSQYGPGTHTPYPTS